MQLRLFALNSSRPFGEGVAAARVTAVTPYLCYSRKDRKTKARDPVATRYVAQIIEVVGIDRVVTVDVHNLAAYQNAFRVPAEHLEARQLFVDHLACLVGDEPAVVVAPDAGGIKRAEILRESLETRLDRPVERAFMEKRRSRNVVSGDLLAGNVAGRSAVIVDDLVRSGTTLARAAHACRMHAAQRVYAVATHGMFTGAAERILAEMPVDLLITDTIPRFRLASAAALTKLRAPPAAPLCAAAIERIHGGGSLVELLTGRECRAQQHFAFGRKPGALVSATSTNATAEGG